MSSALDPPFLPHVEALIEPKAIVEQLLGLLDLTAVPAAIEPVALGPAAALALPQLVVSFLWSSLLLVGVLFSFVACLFPSYDIALVSVSSSVVSLISKIFK